MNDDDKELFIIRCYQLPASSYNKAFIIIYFTQGKGLTNISTKNIEHFYSTVFILPLYLE